MSLLRKKSNSDEGEPIVADSEEKSKAKSHGKCEFAICQKEYPKHVFLIIGNEFCERFCYYGMRAVLQTYLLLQLKQSIDTASTLYHAFAMVAYFTPVLGAIIADSFIGRYWTIVILSVVYVIGNIVMAGTAVGPGYLAGALVGMFTIAVGTGGIKPCVSAFGADQFPSSMAKAQESFFSLFYVSINAGALLSQFITPEVKAASCFGYDSCWVLAFGLPAILMIIALILFVIGTPFYSRVPVKGDVALKLLKAVCIGIVESCKRSKRRVEHWLDRAVSPGISQHFVNDCKAVLKVLLLFVPLPFFWALFDQQGSRWTYQAQKMDSYLEFLNWELQAEQIQIFNCIIVLIFVPIFELLIYPLFAKCGLLVRPLQRMVAGCALAATSFIIIGFVQIAVQHGNDELFKNDVSTFRVRAFNFHDSCSFGLAPENGAEFFNLKPHETNYFHVGSSVDKNLVIIPGPDCARTCANQTITLSKDSLTPITSLTIPKDCKEPVLAPSENSFPPENEYLFYIEATTFTNDQTVSKLEIMNEAGTSVGGSSAPTDFVQRNYTTIKHPGRYKLKIARGNETSYSDIFVLRQGGSYTFAYNLNMSSDTQLLVDKLPNAVSVFLQLIPYTVITWGEIMFSITGLSFAFSQAPATMKSILQAAWLLTVSFGNVIDIIIINIQIPDKAVEFFVFAILMYVVTVIFGVMSYFYKYVDNIYGTIESLEDDEKKKKDDNEYGTFEHKAAPVELATGHTKDTPREIAEAIDNC